MTQPDAPADGGKARYEASSGVEHQPEERRHLRRERDRFQSAPQDVCCLRAPARLRWGWIVPVTALTVKCGGRDPELSLRGLRC